MGRRHQPPGAGAREGRQGQVGTGKMLEAILASRGQDFDLKNIILKAKDFCSEHITYRNMRTKCVKIIAGLSCLSTSSCV